MKTPIFYAAHSVKKMRFCYIFTCIIGDTYKLLQFCGPKGAHFKQGILHFQLQ